MKKTNIIQRGSFSKIPSIAKYPNLLDIQLNSFQEFLQENVAPDKREEQGLQAVFLSTFPILKFMETRSPSLALAVFKTLVTVFELERLE